MNFQTVFRVVKRRWRILVFVPLAVVAFAALLTALAPRVYNSSTETFFTASGGSTNSDMVSGTTYAQTQVSSYMELVTSNIVLGPVIANLELDTDPASLANQINVSVVDGTAVMEISAAANSPENAARLTSEVTNQFVDTVQRMETPPDSTTSNIDATVIREAIVPTGPSSPIVWQNILMALAVGIVIALIVVYLRERADPVIRSEDEFSELTDLPVLGRIPVESKKAGRGIGGESGTPRVEAFNTLRTNLQFVQTAGSSNAFVVTSARPEEGKSMTVANLAASLDGSGRKVLIIEADLRRPKLASYLGLVGSAGLTNVLVGNSNFDDVIQPYGSGNVQVLAAGHIPPNPVELLASPAMGAFLDAVKKEFDLVIVDAPPLLAVTDAAVLSRQAENAIVLIGLGVSERGDLMRSLENLDRVDANVVGVIVNRVPTVESPNAYNYEPIPSDDNQRRVRPSHLAGTGNKGIDK